MKTEGNESAFFVIKSSSTHDKDKVSIGLTKREYFAAKALQGILANSKMAGMSNVAAKLAVTIADNLIQALNSNQ